ICGGAGVGVGAGTGAGGGVGTGTEGVSKVSVPGGVEVSTEGWAAGSAAKPSGTVNSIVGAKADCCGVLPKPPVGTTNSIVGAYGFSISAEPLPPNIPPPAAAAPIAAVSELSGARIIPAYSLVEVK